MSRDELQEGGGRYTYSACGRPQAEHTVEQNEQLLPEILDDITLNLIAPKLPWRTFYILASGSGGWQRAIRSHQVYDARRVRSKAEHTLLVLCPKRAIEPKIVLCSLDDGSSCHLPEIPGVHGGFPESCQWIPLDGKLYVLGGRNNVMQGCKDGRVTSDVYVFDLAGQRQWKQCARMGDARIDFGCSVKDGKIYVFGGSSGSELVDASEVYDREEDAWSPITPIPSFWVHHKVINVGEEFFLHGELPGSYCPSSGHIPKRASAEVYHPRKDEWRTVEHFTRCPAEILFMLGGKLHRFHQDSIEVYDVDANSWEYCRQNLFEVNHFQEDAIYDAVGVDDEILAVVDWTCENDAHNEDFHGQEELWLTKIKGVGSQNTEITWQRLQYFPDYVDPRPFNSPHMCAIQL